jgi:hypothetical protein
MACSDCWSSGSSPRGLLSFWWATGAWSESGASDIISTLANEADRAASGLTEVRQPVVGEPLLLPGIRWAAELQ